MNVGAIWSHTGLQKCSQIETVLDRQTSADQNRREGDANNLKITQALDWELVKLIGGKI